MYLIVFNGDILKLFCHRCGFFACERAIGEALNNVSCCLSWFFSCKSPCIRGFSASSKGSHRQNRDPDQAAKVVAAEQC
uniref:Uncharacterized protein n=1 Tax=Klebsiella pneumoniae TaxID=573 RepID=A0A2P1BPD6_KLEPN|nr:hypothetical protein [Klebsiella pneumoniae]